MQRWIVLGLVAMVLVLGGAAFGYRTYQQNRPQPMWVALPIKPGISIEQQDEIAGKLRDKVSEKEVLLQIATELDLAQKWNLGSPALAADELAKRLFIRNGEMAGPNGPVPSINIGVEGKSKEKETSGKIAMRLMKEVWEILGITPPPDPGAP